MNIESITGKGRLISLDGNEEAISGRKTINFYLTVDEFKDKNVEEVYLISELSSSNFTINNTINGKSLSLLLRSTGSWIHIILFTCGIKAWLFKNGQIHYMILIIYSFLSKLFFREDYSKRNIVLQ